ncbi:MAG: hypothetical protein DRP97_00460 [Candidatus Latescibacterota bacterium]|nr:MAG: hypothetical protein DRP97_00460 [Candidatus Latescibacterota bacterium]
MKKLHCKKCHSTDIRIDVGKSAEYYEDENGRRSFVEDNTELDMIGSPFCGNCGEEWNNCEVDK